MRCPTPVLIPNPTFFKLYPEYGKPYENSKGEISFRSALKVSELQELEKSHDFPISPYLEVPCGKCMICKSRLQQDWIFRIKQEMQSTIGCCHFVTLTYDDLNLPFKDCHKRLHRLCYEPIINEETWPSLYFKDLELFLKRLRRSAEPLKLRFFAVGEYGSKTKRPHYHILLFGLPPLSNQFDPLLFITKSWKLGQVDIGEVTGKSINYVTSYMCLSKEAPFPYSEPVDTRMSRRPGIGRCFLDNEQRRNFYSGESLSQGLAVVSNDGIRMPLPRYYKNICYTEDERYKAQELSYSNKKLFPISEYELEKKEKNKQLGLTTNKILAERAQKRKSHL